MYTSIANVAYNASLLYFYVGDFTTNEDVEWNVHDAILDELWNMLLHVDNTKMKVHPGYTPESKCAYVEVSFDVVLKYALEWHDDFETKNIMELLQNLTHSKVFTSQWISGHLERPGEDHDCSKCKLNDSSSSVCKLIPKVNLISDQAFLKTKHDITCPYLTLTAQEFDYLKRANVISMGISSVRRAYDYLVCINDINFSNYTSVQTTPKLVKQTTTATFVEGDNGTNGQTIIYFRVDCFAISIMLSTLAFMILYR